jgi:DNA topoisomerase-1
MVIKTKKAIVASISANNSTPSFDHKKYWSYKRIGSKKDPRYLLDGKEVKNATLKKRIKSIYVPPAYKNVIVAKSEANPIQIIGTDVKGRRQYLYSSKHIKKQSEEKYKNILNLGQIINTLESDNDNEIKRVYSVLSKTPAKLSRPDDYMPIIVYMLRKYHFRIGNEKYADDNNSYGITTLCKNHIKFTGDGCKFSISFIGKKGVENSVSDDNKYFCGILRSLSKLAEGRDGYLFHYPSISNSVGTSTDAKDTIVSPDQVQKYLTERYKTEVTPKMFRTWYANYHLLEYLRGRYKSGDITDKTTIKDLQKILKGCCEYVSDKLNNTPGISKKSYIDNKIFTVILKNPVSYVKHIPADPQGIHRYLYKSIKKIRE